MCSIELVLALFLAVLTRFSCNIVIAIGGFMASGAKNQLPLVNDLGAPTVGDGSVGRWDGKDDSFFSDGFDVGGHP